MLLQHLKLSQQLSLVARQRTGMGLALMLCKGLNKRIRTVLGKASSTVLLCTSPYGVKPKLHATESSLNKALNK